MVWDSEMDGQMDGCAQGCVKEGALKIGFLSPLPLGRGRLKNNRKIEGSLRIKRERRWRAIARGPVRESAESWSGSFSPAQIPHPITPT